MCPLNKKMKNFESGHNVPGFCPFFGVGVFGERLAGFWSQEILRLERGPKTLPVFMSMSGFRH